MSEQKAPSQDDIKALLQQITDPASGQPLLSMARILTISAGQDGAVGVILDIGDRASRDMEALRTLVEQQITLLDGVKRANVVTSGRASAKAPEKPAPTAGQPPEPPSLKRATPEPPKPVEIPGVRHVIAVASGKGGVGKSTTTVNLAAALQDLGLKVGIMDADIYGPSLPTLLDIKERPTVKDKILQPIESHGLKAMSIGMLLDPDQPVVWRGPRVMGATRQLLHEVAWGPLDVLVVDMPPGTGDVQLTMVQSAPLSGAVIVSTPQDLALIDARKGLAMFRKVDIEVLGLIENMSVFTCPHCGGDSAIFGHGGARDSASELGVDFLGEIPLTMGLRESADAGTPYMRLGQDDAVVKAYRAVANSVAEKLNLAQAQ